MAIAEIKKDDVYAVISDVLERFVKLVAYDLNNRNVGKGDAEINAVMQYMCDVTLNPKKFLSYENMDLSASRVKKPSYVVYKNSRKCMFDKDLAAQYRKFCELVEQWEKYSKYSPENALVKQNEILEFAYAFLRVKDNFILLFSKKQRRSK